MKILTLPPARYPELKKFDAFLGGLLPNPDTSIVVVQEDDNTHEIMDFWVAQAVIHIEPVTLTTKDGGFTAVKLLTHLLAELASRGESAFYAFAQTEDVVQYLLRLGLTPLPYATFAGIIPTLPKE